MEFKSLQVKNFRSFEDISINLSNKNIFFGLNDVGKTNLLTALRFVFDRDTRRNDFIDSDYFEKKTDTPIEILVTVDISDNNDEYGKRPDKITIKLLADGEIEKTQIITPDASGDWKYSFTDLPEYKNGNKIVYSIEEDAVEGYKLGSIVEETTGNFIITNIVEKEYSLPKTGGRGTLLYTIAGSFISLAAIILLVLKHRRPKKI